jgi:hypothetical protein
MTPVPATASDTKLFASAIRAEYRLFSFGSRPVIAVPTRPLTVRRAGIRCFHTETSRRALYRAWIALGATGRWGGLIARTVPLPLTPDTSEAIGGWLADVIPSASARGGVHLVVQWPPQPARQRLYLRVLGSSGDQLLFVKISLDDENDRILTREAATLTELQGVTSEHFATPAVVSCHRVPHHVALALRALPAADRRRYRRRSAFPADAVREYGMVRGTLAVSRLAGVRWFRDAIAGLATDAPAFVAEILDDGAPFALCRAHGDLSVHNLLYADGRPWIFDWEESVADAPALTDRVGFELSALSPRLLRRPDQWRRIVDQDAPMLTDLPRRDLMLALLFRSYRNPSAKVIATHWGQSDNWGY